MKTISELESMASEAIKQARQEENPIDKEQMSDNIINSFMATNFPSKQAETLTLKKCCHNCENKGDRGYTIDTNYACMDCKQESNFKAAQNIYKSVTE